METRRNLLVLALAAMPTISAFAQVTSLAPDVKVADWTVRAVQDNGPAKTRSCILVSPNVGGYWFAPYLSQRSPPDPKIMQVNLFLGSSAWQLGPNSAGTAVVEIADVSRSLMFNRANPTEMLSVLPPDQDSNAWVIRILGGDPTKVKLPNDETFAVPGATRDVAAAYTKCLLLLIPGSGPSKDPFAPVPQPAAPAKDPFAR